MVACQLWRYDSPLTTRSMEDTPSGITASGPIAKSPGAGQGWRGRTYHNDYRRWGDRVCCARKTGNRQARRPCRRQRPACHNG